MIDLGADTAAANGAGDGDDTVRGLGGGDAPDAIDDWNRRRDRPQPG
ncbi:MAG: hypothetical protein ACXW3D_04275 [Caulobacteraceae bacterium]